MSRDLQRRDPLRHERAVVAQRVIASAEILTAEVCARLAVERVVRIVDRAGVDAWILKKRCDERLTRSKVVRQLPGTEVAAAVGADDVAGAGPGWKTVFLRVAHAVIRAEKPE